MEILSTGEKIKRTRIYKGYTLREMCDDKISVSKMSCIENNKVMAEPWVLELISEKLDIDIAYLNENVKEQVEENIKALKEYEKNDQECQGWMVLKIKHVIIWSLLRSIITMS